MQTTLDVTATSSVEVNVEPVRNSTIISDEYANYLFKVFSTEGLLQNTIEKQLESEENEAEDIQRGYDAYLKHEKKQHKPTEYIRVGKK